MSGSQQKEEVGALLKYGKNLLKENDIDAYGLCAEVLLAFATGCSRSQLLARPDMTVDPGEYLSYLKRRLNKEPIQYITGNREFMSLDFCVDKSVLIPRPDTETLVNEAISKAPANASLLDIGTGSGCVAISIAKYRPDIELTGIDISAKALSTAKRNAMTNCVEIRLMEGDMRDIKFAAILGKFDMIVSNPPYIPSMDITGLAPDVRDYEPLLALDGGPDGLDFYHAICRLGPVLLNAGGQVLFEIGCGMEQSVGGILLENGFGGMWISKDLAGINRVIGGEFLMGCDKHVRTFSRA